MKTYVYVLALLALTFIVLSASGNLTGQATANSTRCYDSDGGKNYNLYGIVTYRDRSYNDACVNTTILKENYCYKSWFGIRPASLKYACPYGCEAGACKQQVVNTTCTDSDGGISYNVQGTAIGVLIGNSTAGTYTDYCYNLSTSNNTYVREYFCSYGYVDIINSVCAYGCTTGACLNASSGGGGGANYTNSTNYSSG